MFPCRFLRFGIRMGARPAGRRKKTLAPWAWDRRKKTLTAFYPECFFGRRKKHVQMCRIPVPGSWHPRKQIVQNALTQQTENNALVVHCRAISRHSQALLAPFVECIRNALRYTCGLSSRILRHAESNVRARKSDCRFAVRAPAMNSSNQ